MKNNRIIKNSFRLAIYGGLFVIATAMLSACGESETKTETTDTVVTEPAPIDTVAPIIDSTDTSGRVIMDPKKPD